MRISVNGALSLSALALFLGLGTMAQAERLQPWQLKLQQYQSHLTEVSNSGLLARIGGQSGLLLATCSADFLLTGSSVIAETLPIANKLSEGLAGIVDSQYISVDFDSILDLGFLGQLTPNSFGGGITGIAESVEFVIQWLAGEEDRSFQQTPKIYQSTITTVNRLFSEQGICMMSLSKLKLTVAELKRRPAVELDLYLSTP